MKNFQHFQHSFPFTINTWLVIVSTYLCVKFCLFCLTSVSFESPKVVLFVHRLKTLGWSTHLFCFAKYQTTALHLLEVK